MRDPRKPIIPLAIEEDEHHVQLHSDGTWRSAPKVILSEEDMGRVRAGYGCAKCYEVHEVALPERCHLCGFPMRDRQFEYIAKAYVNSVRIGPSTSLEDELALLDEIEAEIKRKRSGFPVTPQIVVPRGI